jgi:hypothetical protein
VHCHFSPKAVPATLACGTAGLARWARSTRLGIEESLVRLSPPSLVINESDRSAAMTMPRPSASSPVLLKRRSAHSHGRLLRQLTSTLLPTTLLTPSFAFASRSVPPPARPTGCAPYRERMAKGCLPRLSTLSASPFSLGSLAKPSAQPPPASLPALELPRQVTLTCKTAAGSLVTTSSIVGLGRALKASPICWDATTP